MPTGDRESTCGRSQGAACGQFFGVRCRSGSRSQAKFCYAVYRLLTVYRRNLSVSSLLPNRDGRTPGTRLLSSEVETVIQVGCGMRKRCCRKKSKVE
jgi:hypothetical protein